jgi:hypothetical protein
MSQLGHSLHVHFAPVPTNVRYAPKATDSRRKATRRFGPIAPVIALQDQNGTRLCTRHVTMRQRCVLCWLGIRKAFATVGQ